MNLCKVHSSVKLKKLETSARRAAFESQCHAAKGDRIYFGFADGEPVSFVASQGENTAKVEEMVFGKLDMTAFWAVEVSDKDMAALKNALTTKRISAIRITQAGGSIEREISDKNGEAMKGKFACFFQYLDKNGFIPAADATSQDPGRDVHVEAPPLVVPFVKLIQPAFADDYAGKDVSFDATFYEAMPLLVDLPAKYKSGYLRFCLCSESKKVNFGGVETYDCQNNFANVVIPKSEADAVFALKQGDLVSIVAEAVRITGRGERGLLLVVRSIKPH